ncbi:MAG: hypothetical protein H6576_14775 [Lewinellaceae bacterium]|nr:hypothetical protein [Saprospiraceae bacterium]MCB9344961.1 hypothetical protein [Lewinellaceae bacterium]
MKANFQNFAALFLLSFLLSNCQTVKKYVESGNYDDAIDLCVRKLRGKQKKQTEYVQGLEAAFKKAQDRDMALVNSLMSEGRPELWEKIHVLHLDIMDRQNKVRPLTPLVSSKGYKAQFEFVDISRMEINSRKNAAAYLYDQATVLLNRAENGDKLAARKAYSLLNDLGRRYYQNYLDRVDLMAKARDLGTSYILLEVKNQSGKILPQDFTDRLLAISKQELDSEWKAFYFDAKPGEQFDYKAVFNIRNIDISPERIAERAYVDEKRIQDGWEYELDKRGNVKKDSLGNDIKKPKYVNVRAKVLEIHQTKAARLGGFIEIIDANRDVSLESCNLATEVVFEHFAATYKGDARALSKETKVLLDCSPLPFPHDLDMLAQAADRLKPELRHELRGSRAIL